MSTPTLDEVHALIDTHGYTPQLVAAWDAAIDTTNEENR